MLVSLQTHSTYSPEPVLELANEFTQEGGPKLVTSLPLTTTMVNLKILKNSNKNSTLPPGLQDSSQHVGESPDSLNLLSRTSFRASKQVHSRGMPHELFAIRCGINQASN